MKTKTLVSSLLLLAFAGGSLSAALVGTAFTYQGQLSDGGQPANGSYDLKFTLYDTPTSGTGLVAGPITNSPVIVSNGLFTTMLDFGPVMSRAALWLEIGVRSNGLATDFMRLSPRQQLTPTPYAIYATDAEAAGMAYSVAPSSVNSSSLTPGAVNQLGLAANAVTSAKITDGTITAADVSPNTFWNITGNSGTAPGTQFLGTTDNHPLEIKVNGQRVFRLEAAPYDSMNVIAGWSGNTVAADVAGATIGGGGTGTWPGGPFANRVDASLGTVSGGRGNWIQEWAQHAAIGGGGGNTIETDAGYSTISGGWGNTVQTNAGYSAIAGGDHNMIQSNAGDSTISGGWGNTIQTNAGYSTIAGGEQNTIQHNAGDSTITGGRDNDIGADSPYSAIAGGYNNNVGTNAGFTVIGGGYQNNIAAKSGNATIAGGRDNDIGTNSPYSAIGGGRENNVAADSWYATIGGGSVNVIGSNAVAATIDGGVANTVQPYGEFATIPGGRDNSATNWAFAAGRRAKAIHSGAFVWADSTDADFASTGSNQFLIRASGGVAIGTNDTSAALLTVAGAIKADSFVGTGLSLSGPLQADQLNVGGGSLSGVGSSIAGGALNTIEGMKFDGICCDFIGGGYLNTITLDCVGSVITGGEGNTNSAFWSTIAGGLYNLTQGAYAAVPGGYMNVAAGDYSFAAGQRAIAMHKGSFVWADSTDAGFASTRINQFNVRATGGVRFVTGGLGLTVDGDNVALRTGGNSFSGNQTVNGGNIGIGTTSPERALHVVGPNPRLLVEAASGSPEINFKNTGDASSAIWSIYKHGTTGDLDFYQNGNRLTVQKDTGNVGIGTDTPSQKLTVSGNIYATGTITPNSDRNLKTGFTPVDPAAVLANVVALPIQQWRFKAEHQSVKHVGPMAQDFRAAFGLGEIPTAIATVDADGVALAAIQGLNQKLEQRLEQKETEITELKQRLEKLEQLLNAKNGGGL